MAIVIDILLDAATRIPAMVELARNFHLHLRLLENVNQLALLQRLDLMEQPAP